MRNLNDLWTLLQSDVTRASHLVLIDTPTPVRMCSFGDVMWNGELWSAGMIINITMQASTPYAQGGNIEMADPDYSVLASMFGSGIVGAPIKIWYVPTLDTTVEPVLVLDAFADTTKTNYTEKGNSVIVNIIPDDGAHMFAPRERVTSEEYGSLLAPGETIKINNGVITLMGTPL